MTDFKIAEYDEVAAKLDEIKETANFLPDVSSDDGYQKSKRISLDIGKVKTTLEKARKQKKAHFLEGGKQVDSQAKAIMAKLNEIQEPHMIAYKELDNLKKEREAQRKQGLQDRVDYIRNLADNMADSHSSEVKAALDSMQLEECLDFYEFTAPALEARNETIKQLMALFTRKLKEETDSEELAELRKQQAEREQQEREDLIKREAAAKAEAEKQAAIDAKEHAVKAAFAAEEQKKQLIEQAKIREEQIKAANVEAEKQAKIREEHAAKQAKEAEIQRQQLEAKRLADEQEKREANKRHVGHVRKAAKEALMVHGITEDQAKAIILAINAGEVPQVTINY